MSDWVPVALKAGLTLTSLGLVSWPLLRPRLSQSGDSEVQRRLRALLDEKERLLVEIKDLDLSRDTDKISADDYEPMVKQAKAAAADVLRQIDELNRTGVVPAPVVAPTSAESPGRPVLPACPQCGAETDSDDAFCRKCGKKLE